MQTTTTTEIAVIKKSIPNTLLSEVQALEITDSKSLSFATEKLSQINKYLDSVVAWKESKTKPLNTALKVIRAETKSLEEMLENAVDFIRERMSEYATSVATEKAKIAERIGEGRGHLKVETAVNQMSAISVPDVVETESGSLQFRPRTILEITDLQLIPREYLVVNEALLLQALKDGKVVSGATTKIIQVPYNSR